MMDLLGYGRLIIVYNPHTGRLIGSLRKKFRKEFYSKPEYLIVLPKYFLFTLFSIEEWEF